MNYQGANPTANKIPLLVGPDPSRIEPIKSVYFLEQEVRGRV